jgi:AbrB family looped-hinge helix DNA binding protein
LKQNNQNFISKVIADGRITIPKEIRETKGVSEGDFVEIQFVRKIVPKKEANEA